MITVLIPTAKRSDLLANALSSVAAQTAFDQVAEIIVSESGGDRRSEKICQQFPHLPILYVFREPTLEMTEHFAALLAATWSGEHTAFLHDDDWWFPDHLKNALGALASHPEAAVYGCSTYALADERSLPRCDLDLAIWFGTRFSRFEPRLKLSRDDVLLACLLRTPVHYSSMVMKAESLRRSVSVFKTDNKWDADRMLLFRLALEGPLIFSPLPQVFIRLHPSQLSHSFPLQVRDDQMKRTTAWLIEQAQLTWEKAGDLFSGRLAECPAEVRATLFEVASYPWCLPELAKHSGTGSAVDQLWHTWQQERSSGPAGKRLIRSFLSLLKRLLGSAYKN
jgi:hypothetical protein